MERIGFVVKFADESILKEIRKLNIISQKMIAISIKEKLEIDPEKFGKPLSYSFKGQRRLRIGKYRIIYKIDKEKKIVTITTVDHRKDVYK